MRGFRKWGQCRSLSIFFMAPSNEYLKVIQRRGDYGEPRVNFTKDWRQYKNGFGDLNGEFWFGNDFISELSSQKQVMLRVELEAHDGRTAWAEYDNFK